MQVTNWQKISSQPQYQCDIFSIRKDRSRSPNSGREHDFEVLESCDWINIIALTEQGDLVLIRQYRHGTEEITTEIPASQPDENEEIEVVIRPLDEIWSLIDRGIVKHALVLCAFFHLIRDRKLSLPGV